MVTWSYLLATGQIRFGGACDPEIDPLTEGKLALRANPDPSVHRINRPGLPGYSTIPSDGVPECGLDQDGIAYIRLATKTELSSVHDVTLAQQAGERADDLALRGLAAYMVQELNVVRAALPVPLPALTVQATKAFLTNFIKARL